MRVVIQRVSHASVTIDEHCKSAIKKGMLILVGIEEADGTEDIEWLCKKIINLRIFDDENGVMNKSIVETEGDILVISQFTLHASPIVYKSSQTRHFHPALRTILQRIEFSTWQGDRHGRIRCRHESGIAERRPGNHLYRYQKQRIMTLEEAQKQVDLWIKKYGVRYFSELTNMAVLTEEVGELARIMARKYGDQSFKEGEKDNLADEMADVFWVLLCIANQTGVDLTDAFTRNLEKKTQRDNKRHINNPKLSDHGTE